MSPVAKRRPAGGDVPFTDLAAHNTTVAPITAGVCHADTDLTVDEAQALVGRIRQTGALLWAQIEKAYRGRAWIALGYGSWDELCDTEFRDFQLRLPREERRDVVASLRESGMSTRAIASATGASVGTIHGELAGVQNRTPDHGETPTNDEVVDAEILDEAPLAPVIGLDGKRYASKPAMLPSPGKPRRRPLPQQALDAGWQLRKAVERLERVYSDDRFGANRHQIAASTRGELTYIVQAGQDLLDQLDGVSS